MNDNLGKEQENNVPANPPPGEGQPAMDKAQPPKQPPPSNPGNTTPDEPQLKTGSFTVENIIQQFPWANIVFNMGTQYNFQGGQQTGAFGSQAAYNVQGAGEALQDATTAASTTPSTPETPDFSSVEAVEAWFFGLNDRHDPLAFDKQLHIFVVALFAGNSARFINLIKESLKQQILQEYEKEAPISDKDKSDTPKQAYPGVSPFRSQHKSVLQATTTKRQQFTYSENGVPMRVEVLTFEDNRVQPHILEFLRTSPDMSELRDVLQSELFTICQATNKELAEMGVGQFILTRSQAALGLGELAKNDYTYYFNTFIQPLSKFVMAEKVLTALDTIAGNTEREAILPTILGWIFHRLASDPTHKDTVFIQLNQWIESDDINCQIVAASCCMAIGFVDIERTMEIVKKAMASPNMLVIQAVYNSVQVIYQVASGATRLLYHFALWQRLPKDKPQNQRAANFALIFFLYLVRDYIYDDITTNENPMPNLQSNQQQASSLRTIWAIIQDGKQRNLTTEVDMLDLMKGCFVHRRAGVVNEMCNTIEHWITEADKQTALQPIIVTILCTLDADNYAQRHIRRIINSSKFARSRTAQLTKSRCM
jgi:hypothetical protein